MPAAKKKFVIIDGNSILHRAWHALPPLTTKKGQMVNAVYGFASILLKMIREIKPDYLAVAWDLPGPTFRHQEYAQYKATREKKPQELYDQIALIQEMLNAFSIPSYSKKNYEADDVIGTLCDKRQVDRPDVESLIVSGDLDTLQLVDENTKVYALKRGISDIVVYDEPAIKARYGLTSDQLIDFKALRGDPSDNIPGVRGVGEKTAADLMQKFGSLENLYQALEKNLSSARTIKESLKEKLLANKETAFLSKKLVSLVRDLKLEFNLKEAQFGKFDRDRVIKLFQEFEFKTLLPKIPQPATAVQPSLLEPALTEKEETKYQMADSVEVLATLKKEIKKQKELALCAVSDWTQPAQARLIGVGISFKKESGFFLPAKLIRQLKDVLEDEKIAKFGHDFKKDLHPLSREGINLAPLDFDIMLASYLINPGSRTHDLENLAFIELGEEIKSWGGLIKEYKQADQIPPGLLVDWAGQRADLILRLKARLEPNLKKVSLDKLFQEIEMPLIPVLARMEKHGVKLDVVFLKKMSGTVSDRLRQISSNIYQLAGEEFNINSPQQLNRILFEKLKIPTTRLRKTKTGISTAAGELEKMRRLHPIIDLIFEHRELAKLQSTYIEALPALLDPQTNRLHTTFNQAVTATGRLSSSDPNLQNIPIRTKLGREIRKAFIAQQDFKIVAADYSQIELRLIASISADKNMIASFKKGEDIHARTASEIYGVPIEKVTKEMRYAAKTINFGVIYGQGPKALAEQTGLSFEEAREFIEKYFQIYQGVRRYLDEQKQKAREQGYVETLFGRRRYLPEIESGVPMVKAQAERMATNMPVQGTAADLIKMAMIEIDQQLYRIKGNEQGQKARMILQVHDELVFEVEKGMVGEVSQLVKTKMEQVHKLAVPLIASIQMGDSWGAMEEETHFFKD